MNLLGALDMPITRGQLNSLKDLIQSFTSLTAEIPNISDDYLVAFPENHPEHPFFIEEAQLTEIGPLCPVCRKAFCADGASFQCYVFPANKLLMIVLDFFNQGRNFIVARDPSHSFDDINDFLRKNRDFIARAEILRKAIIAGTETLTEMYEPLRTSLLSMVQGIHAGNTTVIAQPTSSYMPRTLTEAPSGAQIIRITPKIVRHDADIPFDPREFDGTGVEPTATAPMWQEDPEQIAIERALAASLVDSRRTAALDTARTTHEQREVDRAMAASRATLAEEELRQLELATAASLEDQRSAAASTMPDWVAHALAAAAPAAPTIPAAAASHPTAPATPTIPAWAARAIAAPATTSTIPAPPPIASTSGAPRNPSETLLLVLNSTITISSAELTDVLNRLEKGELLAVLSSKDTRDSMMLLTHYIAQDTNSLPVFKAILKRLQSLGLTVEEAAELFGSEHTSGTLSSICRLDGEYRQTYRSFFSFLEAGDMVKKLLTAEPSDDTITELTCLLGTLDKKTLLDILNSKHPSFPATTLTYLHVFYANENKKYPVILARLRELGATKEEIIDLFDRRTQPRGRCLRTTAEEVKEIAYDYFPYLDLDYKAVEATTPDTLSTTRPNPT